MNVYIKILLITLLSVCIQHFARLFYINQGYGNTILKHYPGECTVVKGFSTNGSEDMTLLPSGHVIITSGLTEFREFDYSKGASRGALYVMDTNKGYDSVERLTVIGWPEDVNFEPQGIHHWVHENNSVSVFVVLHMPESVARFLYDGKKTVTLTKIYRNHNTMRNVNSVFVTGEDSFYFTNLLQARFRDRLMAMLEFILYIPTSDIVFVHGDQYTSVAGALLYPNGLTGDSRYLYVTTKDSIRIYARNPDDSLSLYKTVPVTIGSLDNMKLDEAGDLWVGCQNIVGMTIKHIADRSKPCYSTVIRVRDPLGAADVESVFADDTSLIQASTVAVYTNRKLLIGSIVDVMVTCDVHYLPKK